jgi:hypothetical protein
MSDEVQKQDVLKQIVEARELVGHLTRLISHDIRAAFSAERSAAFRGFDVEPGERCLILKEALPGFAPVASEREKLKVLGFTHVTIQYRQEKKTSILL